MCWKIWKGSSGWVFIWAWAGHWFLTSMLIGVCGFRYDLMVGNVCKVKRSLKLIFIWNCHIVNGLRVHFCFSFTFFFFVSSDFDMSCKDFISILIIDLIFFSFVLPYSSLFMEVWRSKMLKQNQPKCCINPNGQSTQYFKNLFLHNELLILDH